MNPQQVDDEQRFREMGADAAQFAVTGHDAVLRVANTTVSERTSLVRDTLNLAIPIVVGAITLYILSPKLVKTPVLFFVSISLLLLATIVGLILRMRLLTYIQNITFQLETQLLQITGAARLLRTAPNQPNWENLNRLESTPVQLHQDKWIDSKIGYSSVTVLLLTGVIGITLSLLFRITV